MWQHPAAVLSTCLVKLPVGWPWHICDATFCSVFCTSSYHQRLKRSLRNVTDSTPRDDHDCYWTWCIHHLRRGAVNPSTVAGILWWFSNCCQDTDDGSNGVVSTTTDHLISIGRPGVKSKTPKMASKERCLLGLCPYLFQSPAPFSTVSLVLNEEKKGKAMVMLPMLPCSARDTKREREGGKKIFEKAGASRLFETFEALFGHSFALTA